MRNHGNESLPTKLRARKRLSEELTAQLRKHIIDHGLKPGDPLLTEQEMVEQFRRQPHRRPRGDQGPGLHGRDRRRAAPRDGAGQLRFRPRQRIFRFPFCLERLSREKLLKARVVIETGALYYTMQAMKSDPAYPRLRSWPKRRPIPATRPIRGSSTTSPFTGGWSRPATSRPWPRSATAAGLLSQVPRPHGAGATHGAEGKGHCQISVEALHAGKLETAINSFSPPHELV